MQIKKIIFPTPLEDDSVNTLNDNIDVFVETEDFQITLTVCTPQFYYSYMDKEKIDFIPSGTPDIIVRELSYPIIEKAIEHYCQAGDYWLKIFYLSDNNKLTELVDELI